MANPTKPPKVDAAALAASQARTIAANAVDSAIFCACSTCCRQGRSTIGGQFTCPFPVKDSETKPVCSINVIAKDVIDYQNGGTVDISKYTDDFVLSMIQNPSLIKGAKPVPASAETPV